MTGVYDCHVGHNSSKSGKYVTHNGLKRVSKFSSLARAQVVINKISI
jgi:hypothetical protein